MLVNTVGTQKALVQAMTFRLEVLKQLRDFSKSAVSPLNLHFHN